MTPEQSGPRLGAKSALILLLAINLCNYIDRYVLAAVEPSIRAAFFAADDPNAMGMTGMLAPAFLITYMLSAPALGWMADRFSRWLIVGVCVIFWSLATAAGGLAATFAVLFITRIFVGIGEGGYGPAAPTILADYFPVQKRGRIMAIFCAAIPVGSALGYVLGGVINEQLGWRWAFYIVAIPGLILGLICFFQADPRAESGVREERKRARKDDYLSLLRTRSFAFNCAAQTAMTFALGGLAFWMPAYLIFRGQSAAMAVPAFGGITVVAGLLSTLLGGFVADRLRKRVSGSYFLVSGIGMILAFPAFHRGDLRAFSARLGLPLFRRLLRLSEHRPVERRACKRSATEGPSLRVRAEHPDHPPAWRRDLAPIARLCRGTHKPERRLLHRLHRDADLRDHLALRHEVPRSGHRRGRASDHLKQKQQEQRNVTPAV
jgi:MFS family permease